MKSRILLAPLFTALLALPALATPILAAELPARLDWSQRVELGTPLTGRIASVDAEPGQSVQRGQVLVTLDDRRFQAAVEESEAQVKRLGLARDEAERELERARELFDRTAIPQHDLSLAEIAFSMAEAEHAAARAQLMRARIDLEYSRIEAPFDGVVVARMIGTGETVSGELQIAPLITVASAEPLLARALVGEAMLAELQNGQSVQVTAAGRSYAAEIVHLGLEAVGDADGEALFEVVASFRAPAEHGLRAGLRATLRLP